MKISEITNNATDINLIVTSLKGAASTVTKEAKSQIADYKKQFNPSGHESLDTSKRPDKQIKGDDGQVERLEKVNRLAFPLQKRIVGSTVAFTFGNPVNLLCTPETDQEKTVLGAVKRILADNKIDSFNRGIARELARTTETAECWFTVDADEPHENYGFPTKKKLRVQAFSPWRGDELFPLFDATGDMIAFSRAFKRFDIEDGKAVEVEYFETYTDEEIAIWKKKGGQWEVVKTPAMTSIGKIPIVYGRQDEVEWHDVQWCIERLETLLSNFADTNDYHASPKIFVEGEIVGFTKKGEQGALIQGEKGATAKYLSWDHAPESVRLEVETLLRFIYSFTQTPDVSFDSTKGLKDISGTALKMLFMDAHLKVQDKREVFDAYPQRRLNIVKTFVGTMSVATLKKPADKLEIVPQIVPYMMDDMSTLIDNLMSANGGKPIISQKTAVAHAGLVEDVEGEYQQIQDEEQVRNTLNIAPPAM